MGSRWRLLVTLSVGSAPKAHPPLAENPTAPTDFRAIVIVDWGQYGGNLIGPASSAPSVYTHQLAREPRRFHLWDAYCHVREDTESRRCPGEVFRT
jgi:hypothetical protein